MVYGVVHVHVPGFSRGIDLVVKLVRPGPDVLLQIVVAEVALVETVIARVDGVHLVRRNPLDHHVTGHLSTRVILPDGDVRAAIYSSLNCPLSIEFGGRENSFVAIIIKAVEERVCGHEIVRSQLRFDIWLRNYSADS